MSKAQNYHQAQNLRQAKILHQEGVKPGRLSTPELDHNFSDLHPPLDTHQAWVEADRCYFCYDAPCTKACPTTIDIPLFIRQIATNTPIASAKTILSQNILGGMCARVCPTETLCEQACVRETAEGKPVKIGQLQRYATDHIMEKNLHPFTRKPSTGKHIAVVGAGPAGLSCAHRLAMYGHNVTILERHNKPGGLNEFGIASYKTTNNFAAKEIDWLLKIGGISFSYQHKLEKEADINALSQKFDAVFLAMGLPNVNDLGLSGEDKKGVSNAIDFISELRQNSDLNTMPVGRDVVVIGGGMTAIDAAVQAKMLGALNVTLVYRRGRERMNASVFEQELAAQRGVNIITNALPVNIQGEASLRKIEFAYVDDNMNEISHRFTLPADQLLKAIGQKLGDALGLDTKGGKISVNQGGATSKKGVWAGGDCTTGGEDLTVTAVAEGRDAAENIHATLMANT